MINDDSLNLIRRTQNLLEKNRYEIKIVLNTFSNDICPQYTKLLFTQSNIYFFHM